MLERDLDWCVEHSCSLTAPTEPAGCYQPHPLLLSPVPYIPILRGKNGRWGQHDWKKQQRGLRPAVLLPCGWRAQSVCMGPQWHNTTKPTPNSNLSLKPKPKPNPPGWDEAELPQEEGTWQSWTRQGPTQRRKLQEQ